MRVVRPAVWNFVLFCFVLAVGGACGEEPTSRAPTSSRSSPGTVTDSEGVASDPLPARPPPTGLLASERPPTSCTAPDARPVHVEIEVGGYAACLRTPSDRAWCWGWDAYGSMDLGPHLIEHSARSIAVGSAVHTCLCDSDGQVWCREHRHGLVRSEALGWSRVDAGECVAISASGVDDCALDDEGVVRCWDAWFQHVGEGPAPIREHVVRQIDVPGRVVEIRGGDHHTCARTRAGRVSCWGRDDTGELSDGPVRGEVHDVPIRGARRLAMGGQHSCALTRGGAMCWGWEPSQPCAGAEERVLDDYLGTALEGCRSPTPAMSLRGAFAAIYDGDRRTCGLTARGELECVGLPYDGRVHLPGRLLARDERPARGEEHLIATDILAAGMSGESVCTLDRTGEVRCWGGIASAILQDRDPDYDAYYPEHFGPPGLYIMSIDLATGEPCPTP